jgi:GcrA cell cycle regulator
LTEHFAAPLQPVTRVPGQGGPKYAWTDERVALLQQYVLDGLAASDAAQRMPINEGETLTRNSMIGKAKRLGIRFGSKDLSASILWEKPKMPKSPKLPVAKILCKPASEKRKPAPSGFLHVSLMELAHTGCRFPLGDPHDDNFSYCGRRWQGETGPYCAFHRAIAYQPRKRSAGPGSGFVIRRKTGVTASS